MVTCTTVLLPNGDCQGDYHSL